MLVLDDIQMDVDEAIGNKMTFDRQNTDESLPAPGGSKHQASQ